MKETNNKGGRPPKPGYKKRGKPVMTRFTAANLCKAIALKEKMPEVLKEAKWLDDLYPICYS